MTIIYTLAHPITKEIRYVGKTKHFKRRKNMYNCLAGQLKYKNHAAKWVCSILKEGLKPLMEILEEVPDEAWVTNEIYWIAQFKAWGFNLVNSSEGGDSREGHRLSEEHKRKISDTLKGRIVSAEVKLNMSRGHKGRCYNPNVKLRGGKHRSAKRVAQLDPVTRETIEEFDSISEALIKLGKTNNTQISMCFTGRCKTAFKYGWKLI